jgi:cell division protein FtsB
LKKDASNACTSEQQQQSLQLVDELKRSKAIVEQEVEVKTRRITSLEKEIEQLTEQVTNTVPSYCNNVLYNITILYRCTQGFVRVIS